MAGATTNKRKWLHAGVGVVLTGVLCYVAYDWYFPGGGGSGGDSGNGSGGGSKNGLSAVKSVAAAEGPESVVRQHAIGPTCDSSTQVMLESTPEELYRTPNKRRRRRFRSSTKAQMFTGIEELERRMQNDDRNMTDKMPEMWSWYSEGCPRKESTDAEPAAGAVIEMATEEPVAGVMTKAATKDTEELVAGAMTKAATEEPAVGAVIEMATEEPAAPVATGSDEQPAAVVSPGKSTAEAQTGDDAPAVSPAVGEAAAAGATETHAAAEETGADRRQKVIVLGYPDAALAPPTAPSEEAGTAPAVPLTADASNPAETTNTVTSQIFEFNDSTQMEKPTVIAPEPAEKTGAGQAPSGDSVNADAEKQNPPVDA